MRTFRKKNQGFVLLGLVITLSVALISGIALIEMSQYQQGDSFNYQEEVQALYLAESGIDEAIWYLRQRDPNWGGDFPTEHSLNNGSYVIQVDNSLYPQVTITVTGYVPNRDQARVRKTIQVRGQLI